MSYKKLEVWQLAKDLAVDIHKMTLEELPKFEMYEQASQICRSSKSVRSNIVEGYGRRKYVRDYIKHLTYSLGSNDETIDHLEVLYETGSLKSTILFDDYHSRLQILGKKLNKLIQAIEASNKNVLAMKKPLVTSNQ